MADERPPIRGEDASGLEHAAQNALRKAQRAAAQVQELSEEQSRKLRARANELDELVKRRRREIETSGRSRGVKQAGFRELRSVEDELTGLRALLGDPRAGQRVSQEAEFLGRSQRGYEQARLHVKRLKESRERLDREIQAAGGSQTPRGRELYKQWLASPESQGQSEWSERLRKERGYVAQHRERLGTFTTHGGNFDEKAIRSAAREQGRRAYEADVAGFREGQAQAAGAPRTPRIQPDPNQYREPIGPQRAATPPDALAGLTQRQRSSLRQAATGPWSFDPKYNRAQIDDAKELQRRGLIQQTGSSPATAKKNARITYGATVEGLTGIDTGGDIRAARAETASREIDAARQRLRRVRRPDQKALYTKLVETFERDIKLWEEYQAAGGEAPTGPSRAPAAAAPPPPPPPKTPPAPPAPEEPDPERSERAEQAKTTAVEKATQRRVRAVKTEVAAQEGNLQEFERIARERAADAEREAAAHEAYQRRVAAGQAAPIGSEEFRRQAAQQRADAAAVERAQAAPVRKPVVSQIAGYVPLEPGAAGGGGRDVVRHIAEQEAIGEARVGKELERRETDKLIRAEATERRARELATEAKRREAAESARAPGAALVPRTLANAGARTRAELQEMERASGLQHGPLFGEYPYAPISQPRPGQLRPEERQGVPEAVGDTGKAGTLRVRRSRRDVNAAVQAGLKADAAASKAAAADAKRLAAAVDGSARAMARLEQVQQQQTAGMGRWGAQVGLANQTMRKHGALATEFITAAARGEASYREWGWQIGATAAKFAGWTAVSIPVFAALEGVRRIGQGAVASASGVGVLERVLGDIDASKAQAAFRALSGQFNIPIEQTVDAVFQMAQVFHSLPEATEAAKAALYSFKVGGVDVETSTRNLLAVVTGFGLSGHQLTSVFDQLNQAQNRFGITIANTEAGLAKASGAFRNAGGSVSYLLALIATGQRVTGRTGENIGTAIQRSVGFIQRPAKKQALREFGIDTSQGIEQIYKQAFDVAQTLSGERLQQLATALSSPQYASYFVPILQNRALFERIQAGTSPQASRGSAQRELDRVLSQLDEKIQKVGNSLERLGSSLATGGFTRPFEGMLGSLNLALRAGTGLVGVFGALPGPLRDSLAVLIAIRGAMAAARRVNFGEAFQQRGGRLGAAAAPFLLEDPGRRAQRLVGKGVREAEQAGLDEQQRVVGQAFRASREAAYARERFQGELADIEGQATAGTLAELDAMEARAAALARLTTVEEKAAVEAGRATAAVRAAAEQTLLRTEFETMLRTTPRAERGAATQRFADKHGIFLPPSGRMDRAMAELVEQATFDPVQGRLVFPEGQQIPAQQPRRVRRSIASGLRQVPTAVGDAALALRGQAQTYVALTRAEGIGAAASTATTAVAARAAIATRAAGSAMTGAVAAVSSAGRGMLAMVGGPWGALLAAMLFLPSVYESLQRRGDQLAAAAKQLGRVPTSSVDRNRLRTQLNQPVKASLADQGKDLLRTIAGAGDVSTKDRLRGVAAISLLPVAPLVGKQLFQDPYVKAQQAAQRKRLGELDRLRAQQSAAAAAGRPRPHLDQDVLLKSIDDDFHAFEDGRLTLRELNRQLDLRYQEIDQANIAPTQRTGVRQRVQLRVLRDTPKDFLHHLLPSGSLLDESAHDYLSGPQVAGQQSLVQSGLASRAQRRNYVQAQIITAVRNLRQGGDLQAGVQAQQNVVNDVNQGAEAELERSLLFARSQRQRDRAYSRYYEALNGSRTAFGGIRAFLREQKIKALGDLATAVEMQREAQEAVDAALKNHDVDGLRAALAQQGSANRAAGGARSELGRVGGQERSVDRVDKQAARDRRADAKQKRDQQFQDAESLRQAREAAQLASIPQGPGQTAAQIRIIGAQVARAIKQFGRDSVEVWNLIAQQRQLQQQASQEAVQEQAALIQADAAYAAAGQTTAAGQGAANIAGLGKTLAYQQAHPGTYKPSDIRNTQAQLRAAQVQQAQQLRQDALELLDSQFALREAHTDNPVKQAELEAQHAAAVVKRGGFQTPAERNRALAEQITKRRDAEQAVNDRRLENVDYEHDIGKLTDNAYIHALERIERTMKQGSEARRQLRMRIGRLKHDMESESELELNVGNIRLPSVYDVRRLAAHNQGTSVVNQSNTVNVNGVTDPEAVGAKVHHVLTTGGKAAMRAAGYR